MTAIDAAAKRIRATAQLPLPQAERAQRIVAAIREATGHRWVGIYAVAAGEVANLAWSGPAPPAHLSFPADAGLTAAAIQTRGPVVSGDVSGDPRYLEALPTTASEMIVPIVVDGTVVGTLDVESDRADAFGAADRTALERIAAALADLWAARMTVLALAWLAGSAAVAVGLGELLVKVKVKGMGMGRFPVGASATIHHG